MVRRIKWSKKMTAEDRKAVRDFLKDYDTEDLTVVFADKWSFKAYEGGTYSINTEYGQTVWGLFLSTGYGLILNYAGVRYLHRPAILVDMEHDRPKEKWKKTFLHEFGHYLHWKEDPQRFQKESTKEKERRAREFAELLAL